MDREKDHRQQDKKPYTPPRLTHYGALRTITQAVGNFGNLDGAIRGPNRTSETG